MFEPEGFVNSNESDEKARFFLISNSLSINPNQETRRDSERLSSPIINTTSCKIKRTTNRKQITTANTIIHNDKEYRINNGNGKCGLYTAILHRMIEQFEIAQQKWGRVFMLRIELHLPHETQDNKCITGFNKRLFQRLKREYGFSDIGFCWAREYHGKGKGQHYHYALFLDGNKIRHSTRINGFVRASWERAMGGYSLGYIKRPFYLVDSEDVAQDAVYRLSYLAKTRGKGHRPSQTKDFQCSRMKR